MKMNDFFKFKTKCPMCSLDVEMLFETDAIGQRGNDFSIGDNVSQNNLLLWCCDIERAIASCPKCQHHVYGTIRIQDRKFQTISAINPIRSY